MPVAVYGLHTHIYIVLFLLLGQNYYPSSLPSITQLQNHNRFIATGHSPPFPPPASLSTFQLTSETEIFHLLQSLPNKQCELDPIPTSLLKDCASILVPVITKIVNFSLST